MRFLRRSVPPAAHGGPVSLRAALLSAPLFDELTIGILSIGLPLARDRLHLSYAQAGMLFTAGGLAALLIDPLVNLLSDRSSKRVLMIGGILGLVLGFSLAGAAPGYVWLLAAFALIWPAITAAMDLAQAGLIDMDPAGSLRTMVRWTLLGGAGDLLAPAAVGLLAGAGFGWPVLCAVAASCWLVLLAVVAPQRFATAEEAQPQAAVAQDTVPAGLRMAVRDRVLLRWMGVELAAAMLDEVFISFAALYLHDHLGATPAQVGFALLPGAIAALLSLAVLERVLPTVERRYLLPITALVALCGMVVLLTAGSLPVAVTGLVVVHAGAAVWYPVARAAAYDRYPGRSGLVRAILSITDLVELVLPVGVGLVAARSGILMGLALLGVAPILVLLLAPRRATGLEGP